MIEEKENKESNNTKALYGESCIMSVEAFKGKYNVDSEKGLTTEEAQTNLKKYGINQIKQAKPKKWYNYLISSLLSPFNKILLGISLILVYTDIVLPENPSYANILVIIFLKK